MVSTCRNAAEAAAEAAAAAAAKRRPGRPRKIQVPSAASQHKPQGDDAPPSGTGHQLRTRQQRKKIKAAAPCSPSSSADLAAELAPGLLLADDAEDPSFEPANIHPESEDDEEDEAVCGPAAPQSSPVTRSATLSAPGAMHMGNTAATAPSALAQIVVLKSTARKTANPSQPPASAAPAAAAAALPDASAAAATALPDASAAAEGHDAAVVAAGAPDVSEQALQDSGQAGMLAPGVHLSSVV